MKQSQINPPQLAKKLLHWFLREDIAEEVEGDLEEKFNKTLKEHSKRNARRNYWFQVIRYIRPFAIKKSNPLSFHPFFMFRHNLLLSFRNFTRHKSTFLINLIGLSTGLTCALLIYLWVNDENSIDKFHEKSQRLMQVMQRQENSNAIGVTGSTPWLLAETLKDELPEVEFAAMATPTEWFEDFTLSVGKHTIKATGQYVSQDYFSIFSYPLVYGNPNQLLSDKHSIVFSEELAYQLFHTKDNVTGRTIEFQHESEFLISGVFKNVPTNSSVQFEFVLPIQVLIDQYPEAVSWKNSGPETFLTFKEGTHWQELEQKLSGIITAKTDDTHRTLFLVKYVDHYLHAKFENGVLAGGRIEYVHLFSLIAVFIIMIACINFMNLATARASTRLKEVGVKKSIGASRHNLILQYLSESMSITLASLLLALLLVYLLLPQFNYITGKHLTLNLNTHFILLLVSVTLLTGLLAGSYPALYLSSFKPAVVLKGKLMKSVGESWTRKGLVVFQFSISVIFISAILVIYKQLEFVQSKNLGYDKDNVIHFGIEGTLKNNTQTFIDELNRLPGVIKASSIGQSMVGGGNTSGIEWDGKDQDERVSFAYRPVNYDVMEMLDLQFKEGRPFSRNFNDSMAVIFNETAIARMNLNDPVGKEITFGPFNCKIIGVIKDFHFESLYESVKPMFFILAPAHTEKIIVKLEDEGIPQSIDRINKFYAQFNPGFDFTYKFLDQEYQQQYAAEQRISVLSRYFGALAIVISAMGLFGLATFTAERRQKEIGIRKVLGSSEWNIIYLLSNDFTKIIIFSIVIALPISYLLITSWLDSFAFHISLHWGYFLGAGLFSLLVAWATISTQALRVAKINPSVSLKSD